LVKELYLTKIPYLQVTGKPSCDREITAVAADVAIDVNVGVKQFVGVVDS